MGRYYTGQISGKFWAIVQYSNDAENFGVCSCDEPNYKYTCECEDFEEYCLLDDVYCGECDNCHCEFKCEDQEATHICFHFDEDNVDDIQKVLDEIKVILPDIPILVFDEDNEFEYEFKYDNKEHLDLQARWCLGQQILACIVQLCECDFSCEL
jgi:hypothetical protein